MSYHALARKYRPATFAQMVGQQHVTTTLRAALRKDKLSHAYLLAGPRGTGKTTVARLLAKALNCANPQDTDPCGECETCKNIALGSYLDVLEIDAASHTGVDNIRDLRDMAQYSPTKGGCRVFIIDEVHMLSKGAFNALLKILEEPPPRVHFFFATTEPTKIPRTILSRCQRFDFRLLTQSELSTRFQEIAAAEATELTESGLRLLVALAEGSMRDGLSILDQLIAASDGAIDEDRIVELFGLIRSEIYHVLNEAIIQHDSRRVLQLVEQLLTSGQSLDSFAQGVLLNFRNLLLLKIDPELASAMELSPDQIETLSRQAESFTQQDLLALIDRACHWYERIHRSSQPRILLEAALVEFAQFESRVLLSDLMRRLQALTGGSISSQESGSGSPATGDKNPGRSGRDSRGSPGSSARGASGRAATAGARTGARNSARNSALTGRVGYSQDSPAKTDPESLARENSAHVSPQDLAAPPAVAASAAETIPGWTGFIQALYRSYPGLASCLMEGLPSLDEAGRRLTIAFPADKAFQMQNLERARDSLEPRVADTWGDKIKLQFVVLATGPDNGFCENLRKEVAPTSQEKLADACNDDETLAELVDLLKGEPISDQEQDTWSHQEAPPPPANGPVDAEPTADQLEISPPPDQGDPRPPRDFPAERDS
ncbi:MAG: DNA polymerase III subunit gamma/tau [bacterium]